jgi:prevent-host-death family protein
MAAMGRKRTGPKTVNVHEAKTHLSKLLERVEAGDEIIIARAGQPVARLIAFARPGRRVLGLDAGKGSIATDFDAPLPDEVLADFE